MVVTESIHEIYATFLYLFASDVCAFQFLNTVSGVCGDLVISL